MKYALAAVLLGSLVTGSALAEDTESYAAEVTASRLNLRAGPSDTYQPVARVEQGTRLVVTGRLADAPEWVAVEVPQGYRAWVFARFVAKRPDGTGILTASGVLIRPQPTTRYHQLHGRLDKNEVVKIVGEKATPEGTWYRIDVPRRIPLFAHGDYLKKIGPASLADEPAANEEPLPAAPLQTAGDQRFLQVEGDIRAKLGRAKTLDDIEQLKAAIAGVDRDTLSLSNRERRVKLLADIVDAERRISVESLKSREYEVKADLDRKLKEIQLKYEQRLREIRAEFEREKKSPYTAVGIVEWRPDLVGRFPSFRLAEGGNMRYYLITTDFDLHKFVGKRVGVNGLADPESGTGYETIMVERIEILGDK